VEKEKFGKEVIKNKPTPLGHYLRRGCGAMGNGITDHLLMPSLLMVAYPI